MDDAERSSMRRHLGRNDAVGVSATNKGFYDASGANRRAPRARALWSLRLWTVATAAPPYEVYLLSSARAAEATVWRSESASNVDSNLRWSETRMARKAPCHGFERRGRPRALRGVPGVGS